MDKNEARTILAHHLEGYRKRSYRELIALRGHQGCHEVIGPSGTAYQIEVDVMWDGNVGGGVRVVGSIDDGHLFAAFRPLTESFLIVPEGHAR